MRVFYIHNLIADVIGCFDQINQRETGVLQGSSGLRPTYNAQFIGNLLIVFGLALKETKLAMSPRKHARKRIFHNTCQHRIGHYKASYAPTFETMRQQSKGICIAFKMRNVAPKWCRNMVFQS